MKLLIPDWTTPKIKANLAAYKTLKRAACVDNKMTDTELINQLCS